MSDERRDPAVGSGDSPPSDEQMAALLQALREDDQNPELWVRVGQAFLARGELGQALRCGRSASRLDPEGEGSRGLMSRLSSEARGEGEGRSQGAATAGSGEVRQGADSSVEAQAGLPPEPRHPPSPEKAVSLLARELAPRETIACPDCGTRVEVDEPWCFGCGGEMERAGPPLEIALEERMNQARGRLEANPEDLDALFTVGASLAVNEEFEEALEVLNRLTLLDSAYPGLWWLKARVFEGLGKDKAAEAAMRQALREGPV